MSLGALARVAAFSPFHFHRVFRAVTGETLFGFIQRVRLERSAGALLAVPDRSVLEVALDHGFSSSATFARAFKGHFGMSATEWRRDGAERWPERRRLNRKLGKQLGKPGNARTRRTSDTPSKRNRSKEGAMNVRVQELPSQRVACMRYVGPLRRRRHSGGLESIRHLGPGPRARSGEEYEARCGPRRSGDHPGGEVPLRRVHRRA